MSLVPGIGSISGAPEVTTSSAGSCVTITLGTSVGGLPGIAALTSDQLSSAGSFENPSGSRPVGFQDVDDRSLVVSHESLRSR